MNTKRTPFVRSPNREANERFVHLRNVNLVLPNKRTVKHVTAFIRTNEGADFVSFAENDARDQFCKRTGRTVARRKWFVGKRVPLLRVENVDGLANEPASLYETCLDTYYQSVEGK